MMVNAPSRKPAACTLIEITGDWKAHLLVEYSKNKFPCKLINGLISGYRYRVEDEVIFYKDRICLISESTLKKDILEAAHDPQLTGHQGLFETYRQIKGRFFRKGLKDDVLRRIKECMTCQQNKPRNAPVGLLQTMPTDGNAKKSRQHLEVVLAKNKIRHSSS